MKFWKKSKISQLKVDWWFLGLEVRWWWKGFISWLWCYLSVQFNHSVVSDSATPWTAACRASLSITNSWSLPNSCPLSWWCHPTISSFVVPFCSCLQSFPASGSFQMSQFFTSGGQSVGILASTSVLPMNIQDWFSLGWTGWIFLQSKRLSGVFSNTTVQKHQFSSPQLSLWSNSYIHTWLKIHTEKIIALTRWTFDGKVMSLLLNMLIWS